MKLIKFIACFLSVFTFCITPLAEAAGKANQQRQLVNQYLKEMGLTTRKMTASEYWRMVRHAYPEDMRLVMDRWVSLNREQLMPNVQASAFKDSDGHEQVRLTLSRDGQSVNITLTGNEDFPLKVNGVTFSKKEINEHNLVKIAHRLVKEDASIGKSLAGGDLPSLRKDPVMSYGEFQKLTPLQRAEYLIRLRETIRAAQFVYTKAYGKHAMDDFNRKYEWVQQFFFGEDAQAAGGLTGKTCVVAGYLSVYGENQSCGGQQSGAQNLKDQISVYGASCSGRDVPCNPLVYGFKDGSSAYCVPYAQVKEATANCNSQSPLNSNEDKKRIIESFLKKSGKNIDLKFNAEGKISQEQLDQVKDYLGRLNGLIGDARGLCKEDAGFAKIQRARPDQADACNALLTRAMDLQAFVSDPTPPALPAPTTTGDLPTGTCSEKPGSRLAADGKTCQCPEGTQDGSNMNEQGQNSPACVPIAVAPSKPQPIGKVEDSCGFFCRNKGWIIALGIGAAAFGLIWWLGRNKSSASTTTVYTPPAGPPQVICDAPMTLVNGVCQAPAVVTPPTVVVPPPTVTTTSEGGTTVDTGGNAGGVR